MRKLNIASIVLQLSLRRIGVEVAIATSLNAVRDMDVKRKWNSRYGH